MQVLIETIRVRVHAELRAALEAKARQDAVTLSEVARRELARVMGGPDAQRADSVRDGEGALQAP